MTCPPMKDLKLEVRLSFVEKRAVSRLCRAEGKTISELVRARVIGPALSYDPRQRVMSFDKGDSRSDPPYQ